MIISTLSPAKLNLFLHITGKRDDGYHDLQTVFRLLDWGDSMRFEQSTDIMTQDTQPVRLHCNKQLTTNPADNLIVKAAHALVKLSQKIPLVNPLPIIDVYLDKRIPTGAGLGGGSSNAATTLMALNQLWQLKLTKQQLISIGVTLGADVPIFIYGQDAIAEGVGELLTPINLPKTSYILLTPTAHIATSELFAHPQLCRNKQKISISDINAKSADFLHTLTPPFTNVFEPVVTNLNTNVNNALAYLRQFEAHTQSRARMTGSGSCVFLPINNQIDNSRLQHWLAQSPCPAYLVNSSR